MWYVVQVCAGSEESIRIQCENHINSSVLQSCFIPYYEEKRKVNGSWRVLQQRLFPGYLFVVTDKLEELFFSLKKINGLTRLIGTGDDVIPLKEEEVEFILRFGGKEHLVEMSEGIIEGDRIIITNGPLVGQEGLIKKIDRHKRKAWLELEMFGRMQRVEVGLEITRKVRAVSGSAGICRCDRDQKILLLEKTELF